MKFILLLIVPFLSFGQVPGDTNGDNIVDLNDLFNVLQNWLQNESNDENLNALEGTQEMIETVDSMLNLIQNINYGLSIEGWVEHDYQATWCCYNQCYAGGLNSDATWGNGCPSFEESNINTALSSGIVSVHTYWDAEGYTNGCAGNKILIYVNNELIVETTEQFDISMSAVSFPIKKNDEFVIYTYCPNSNLNDFLSENNIKFFSFGDSNYGESSEIEDNINQNNSLNNKTLLYTIDGF